MRNWVPELDAALEESACLGAWAYDIEADDFSCAKELSLKLGVRCEATGGVPLSRFLQGIQAIDRTRVENIFVAALGMAGPFELEFRTTPRNRASNWLRFMGRAEAPSGKAAVPRLRGLCFDLTERCAVLGSPAEQMQHQINQLAGHAIAMKSLVAGLDNSPLSKLVDAVAVEIGAELARSLSRFGAANRH